MREELGELSEPAPKKITIRAGLNRTQRGCWEKADHFSSSSAPLVTYPWLSHSWIYATPLTLPPQPRGMFPTHPIHPQRNTLKINWVVITSHYVPTVLKET